MKRPHFSIWLAIMFALCWVRSAESSSIIVSDALGLPGDTEVLLTITLDNTVSYAGCEFILKFDYSLLTLNRIEPTTRLAGQSGIGFYEFSLGQVSVVFFDFDGNSVPIGSDVIFDVYFDISDDPAGGLSEISISEVTAVAENLDYDTVTVNNGYLISCHCPDFCDVNLNGGINPLDIVILVNYVYKMLDGREVMASCPAEYGDWDCTSQVNPVDVVWMVNYVYRLSGIGPCAPCTCSPFPEGCPPFP